MYKEVKAGIGVSCYTDAYLKHDNRLYFISLYGRPGMVRATGAAIIEFMSIMIEDEYLIRPPAYKMRTFTQNLGGICHKVLLCPEVFSGSSSLVLIREDKKRAFEFLDSNTSTPLKPEWLDWLWDKVFEKVKLDGFGNINGQNAEEAYLLSFSRLSTEIDELVLDGIRAGELR